MTTIKSDSIVLPEQTAAPTAPAAGNQQVFIQDGHLYAQDSTGSAVRVTPTVEEQAAMNRMAAATPPIVEASDTYTLGPASAHTTVLSAVRGLDLKCVFRFDADYNPIAHPTGAIELTQTARLFMANGNLWAENVNALQPGVADLERSYLYRLNPDFSIDWENSPAPFFPAMYTSIGRILIEPDGKLMIPYTTGSFYDGRPSPSYLNRYNLDMTVDETFSTTLSSTVTDILRLNDGRYVIVGNFQTVNGVSRKRIAILNNDGTLDTSFDPGVGFTAQVNGVVLTPANKLLVYSLTSTAYNGVAKKYYYLINLDGTLDTSYDLPTKVPGFNPSSQCYSTIQDDGSVILVGAPTALISADNPNKTTVLRMMPDGTLDPNTGLLPTSYTFEPGGSYAAGPFMAAFRLSNGNIVVYRKAPASPVVYPVSYIDGTQVSGVFILSPTGALVKDLDVWWGISTGNGLNGWIEDEDGGFVSSGTSRVVGRTDLELNFDPDLPEGFMYYLVVHGNDPARSLTWPIGTLADDGQSLTMHSSSNMATIYQIRKIAGVICARRLNYYYVAP